MIDIKTLCSVSNMTDQERRVDYVVSELSHAAAYHSRRRTRESAALLRQAGEKYDRALLDLRISRLPK